jgi:Protein of unknown function (DUF2971)
MTRLTKSIAAEIAEAIRQRIPASDDQARWLQYLDRFAAPPEPELLWHYTDWKGLQGICENGQLWPSRIGYLNDTQEFRQAFDVFKLAALGPSEARKSGGQKGFEAFLNANAPTEGQQALVTSFSEEGDALGQWRGYGSTLSFSIGFSLPRLRVALDKAFPRSGVATYRLDRCEYDPDQQRAMLQHLIQRASNEQLVDRFQAISQFQPPPDEATDRLQTQAETSAYQDTYVLSGDIGLLSPFMKHPKFREEDEWRLVVHAWQGKTKYRTKHSMPVPYAEIDIGQGANSPIDQIIVGPCPHSKEACAAASLLANDCKIPITKVEPSQVPYRNW